MGPEKVEGEGVICPHCGVPIVWQRVTPEIRAQILEGYRLGWSLRDIERIIGVSFSTAGRVIRDSKVKVTGGFSGKAGGIPP